MLIKKSNKSIGLKLFVICFSSIFLSMSALAVSDKGYVGEDEIEISVERIFIFRNSSKSKIEDFD